MLLKREKKATCYTFIVVKNVKKQLRFSKFWTENTAEAIPNNGDKSRGKLQDQSESASEACSSSAILGSAGPEVDDGLQGTVEENVPPTASERKIMAYVESTSSDVVEGKERSIKYILLKPYYSEDPGYRFFHL